MKKFSEIDIDEGLLDKTTKKVKDTKKLTKDMVVRGKKLAKVVEQRHLIRQMWGDAYDKLNHTNYNTDFFGNEIRFGDLVVFSPSNDSLNCGNADYGFVVSEGNELNQYEICDDFAHVDWNEEDPLKYCSMLLINAKSMIVLSRVDDLKSYAKVAKNLYK